MSSSTFRLGLLLCWALEGEFIFADLRGWSTILELSPISVSQHGPFIEERRYKYIRPPALVKTLSPREGSW